MSLPLNDKKTPYSLLLNIATGNLSLNYLKMVIFNRNLLAYQRVPRVPRELDGYGISGISKVDDLGVPPHLTWKTSHMKIIFFFFVQMVVEWVLNLVVDLTTP